MYKERWLPDTAEDVKRIQHHTPIAIFVLRNMLQCSPTFAQKIQILSSPSLISLCPPMPSCLIFELTGFPKIRLCDTIPGFDLLLDVKAPLLDIPHTAATAREAYWALRGSSQTYHGALAATTESLNINDSLSVPSIILPKSTKMQY